MLNLGLGASPIYFLRGDSWELQSKAWTALAINAVLDGGPINQTELDINSKTRDWRNLKISLSLNLDAEQRKVSKVILP